MEQPHASKTAGAPPPIRVSGKRRRAPFSLRRTFLMLQRDVIKHVSISVSRLRLRTGRRPRLNVLHSELVHVKSFLPPTPRSRIKPSYKTETNSFLRRIKCRCVFCGGCETVGECEDGALDHVKGETMSEATVNSDLDPLLLLCLRIRLLSVLAPLPSLLTPPPPERVHLSGSCEGER